MANWQVIRDKSVLPDDRRPAMRSSLTMAGAIEAFLDPAVILLWLLGSALWFQQPIGAKYVAAAVLAFALTYPGNVSLTDTPSTIARKCALSALTVMAGLALFGYASGWLKAFQRSELLAWFAFLPLALFGAHMALRGALPKLLELANAQDTAVVCGVNDIGAELAARLEGNPFNGVRFLGFFDDRRRERLTQIGDRTLKGTFDELGEYARHHRVDRIYLALPMATQPRILKMLDDLQDSTASIYFAPDIFVTDLINGRMESLSGMPVVAVRDTPFSGVNSIVKRLEDIVFSTVMLTLLAPLMLAIAIGVRLSSPGPILFRQKRYGLDGRDIVVYKFRSMTVIEDGTAAFTAVKKDDGRVTRFGQFIRKTSLDELPQVINVLQGRMSLVGPRPHAVMMNEQFRKLIPGYMLRHKVKPGITGLAQVRGFRGGDDLAHMRKRIECDLEYLRHWSFTMDMWILARTAFVVFGDSKAY